MVEDSDFYRQFLKEVMNGFEEYEVVGVAEDAYDAREKIKQLKPDLVTIDINMPKMDGIAFLQNLIRLHPMPAFIISSESSRLEDAYEEGALGFIEKTRAGESPMVFVERLHTMLNNFIYLYDRYRKKNNQQSDDASQKKLSPDILIPSKPALKGIYPAIAIAASTGGIEAISAIVQELPEHSPPIFIVQHIPQGFSTSFIRRLATLTTLNVVEVKEPQMIEIDTIYMAGKEGHLVVSKPERLSQMGMVEVVSGPRISRHSPSADIMFRSLNNTFGKGVLGIILTGMGDDGVIGLKELFDNGAHTIAQDKESCVVFGMPQKAIEANGVKEVLSLRNIGTKVRQFALLNSNVCK